MRKTNLKLISIIVTVLIASFFILPSVIFGAQNIQGGSGTRGLVNYVYEQVLGREPSQGEVNTWVNSINKGGASAYTLVNAAMLGIEKGPQINSLNNKDYVYLLYKVLFGRTPDLNGLNAWYNRLQSGNGKNVILQGFIVSTEFANLCGQFGVKPYYSREVNNRTIAGLYMIGTNPMMFPTVDVPQEVAVSTSTASSSGSSQTTAAKPAPKPAVTPAPPKVHHHAGENCSKCH